MQPDSRFKTLMGLVARYSPSGQEQSAVTWLIDRMKTLGYTNAYIDKAGNAVGVMGAGPRQVILLGHIDTVPGEIEVVCRENVLYGRGTVDAKGPLACFVDAVAQIGAVDGWQFIVIGAVEEERDSDGARYLVDKYQPDFLIVGEPNRWHRVALGYKGLATANVIVRGAQRHTASGAQTVAEAAVAAWLAVKNYTEAFNRNKARAFDQILPVLQAIQVTHDGFEQKAQLHIGCRLPPDVGPDAWYQALEKVVKTSGTFQVVVERSGHPLPAWKCEKNSLLVRAFLHGIRKAGGRPRFVYKTGTADLNVVAPVWRCPAVVYGPGDSALDHTPDEHISLNEYQRAVDVLTEALLKLVNTGKPPSGEFESIP